MKNSPLLAPFLAPIETARRYSIRKLRRDLVAGLTVSVVEIPQAMAYALIAGVPPQYGIYTSVIQGIMGALLGSGEHLTTGPTNTQSLLIASAVTRLASPEGDPAMYLQLVFILTFLKGIIQLIFAAASLGNMVRYVSRSVIVGLSAGAGVLIAVGQLPNFLGIDVSQAPKHLPGVLGAFERLVPNLGQVNPRAVTLGAICLAIVLGVRMVSKLLPGALLAVVVAAIIVWLQGWDSALPIIGELPRGLPEFNPPELSWSRIETLLGGALALAMLGMLESVAIAKTIATHTGERIVPNQEFFAQGITNFVSSFFQCIPGSGSFTRSALDHAAGAETRFAAVYNGMFVGLIYLLFAGQAKYIPLTALAAVLLVIAYGLVDWGYIPRMLRSSRSDAVVCLITFLATLFVPLEYAIFIGIFLNIALYLRVASRLHMAEMVQTPGSGMFFERPIHDRSGHKQVMFLQVEGDLFFGVADELHDQLNQLQRGGVQIVILRLKRTHSLDATVLHVLEQFTRDMKSRGGHVILCGVRPQLMTTLRSYGLIHVIGKENVFEASMGVFTSAKRALQRAKELVGQSIDATGIDVDEPEAWAYEI
jgi:SulP family sulfate permease